MDLGSGKGYLSQYLALQYGLNVIGVDSSYSNTQNAAKRNERVLKVWKGLVRKSQREKANSSSNISKEDITSSHVDSQPLQRTLLAENIHVKEQSNSKSLSNCCTTCCTSTSHACNHDGNNVDTNDLQQTCQIDGQKGSHLHSLSQNTVETENKLPTASDVHVMETKPGKNKLAGDVCEPLSHESSSSSFECQQSTVQCKRACDRNIHVMLDGCYNDKSPHSGLAANAVTPKSQRSQTANPSSFVPVTGFVDQAFVANGELARLFDEMETSDGVAAECNGMFLVGLHTCGDLAPMALRIFVNEPSVKLICIVGCCYHLVSQECGSE